MLLVLSYLCYIYFFASSAIFVSLVAIAALASVLGDKNRRLAHEIASIWAAHYLYINPFWKYKVHGKENIDKNATYVIVANHMSLADIFVVYSLGIPFKWISKEEVLKVPLVGWNLLLNECVLLKRGDRKSIISMLNQCKHWLVRRVSIAIFPEGTRSSDGQMHKFKDGAFRLSMECNVKILPVVINGTQNFISRDIGRMSFFQPISATILPAIDPVDFDGAVDKFRDSTYHLMSNKLAEIRGIKPNLEELLVK